MTGKHEDLVRQEERIREEASRFWRDVEKRSSGECWEWIGRVRLRERRRPNGQGIRREHSGRIAIGGKEYVAHRVAWIIANGVEGLEGKQVHHICENPLWDVRARDAAKAHGQQIQPFIAKIQATLKGMQQQQAAWPIVSAVRWTPGVNPGHLEAVTQEEHTAKHYPWIAERRKRREENRKKRGERLAAMREAQKRKEGVKKQQTWEQGRRRRMLRVNGMQGELW